MPPPSSALPVVERIKRKLRIDPESGCWLWTGGHAHGYGLIQVGSRSDGTKRTVRVHRVMYEHYVGPILDGLQTDHLCRQTLCCNPEHLEIVTPRENSRRRVALITHCPRGHPYEGDNLYTHADGRRICRTCARLWMREKRSRLQK